MASNVRISENSYTILKQVSKEKNVSLQDALDDIVSSYKKEDFYKKLNDAALKLKNNPQLYKEDLEERQLLDNTLMDDLSED